MAITVTPLASLMPHPGHTLEGASSGLADEIKRLRKFRDREFAKLTALPGRDRHSLTRKLLRLPALHRLYAYEGLRKAGERASVTPARLATVAEQCNPLHPCAERSTSRYVGSGQRRRLVTIYGPAKRARQMMVADLLRYLHPPLDQQFLFRGGMPAAFRAVETAYAEGFTWGTETDLVGFYPSVGLDGLAELLRPLPSSVVDHVVWDHRATGRDTVVDDTVPTSLQWAYPSLGDQRGIPLGSACSPRVGERIVAMLIASISDCRTIAYADNILVVGRSSEAVAACVQTMRNRITTFGGWASRLRLRDDGIKELDATGFSFLHHEAVIENGGFIWRPDHRKMGEFFAAHEDGDGMIGHLSLDAIAAAEVKIAHWRRAYPNWPEGDVVEVSQLAALAARRFYIDASPLNRTMAATALVASYFANRREQSFDELTPGGPTLRADLRRQQLIEDARTRLFHMAQLNGYGPDVVGLRNQPI
jgi:hypothetical protein